MIRIAGLPAVSSHWLGHDHTRSQIYPNRISVNDTKIERTIFPELDLPNRISVKDTNLISIEKMADEEQPEKKHRPRLYDAPLPYDPLSYDRGGDLEQVRKDRERLFAMVYCATLDPVEAGIRAGYKVVRYSECRKILESPNVQAEIAKFRKVQEEKFQLKAADFIRHLHYGAMGRFTKVMKVKMVNCRYCWGENNEYQRTEQEMNRDLSAHIAKNSKLQFDQKGGVGFDADRPPNLHCTNCHGRGIEKVYLTPTDEFDQEAEAIWDGADIIYEQNQIKRLEYHRVDRAPYLRALAQYYLGTGSKRSGVVDRYDFDSLTEEEQITMLEVNSPKYLTQDLKDEVESYLNENDLENN